MLDLHRETNGLSLRRRTPGKDLSVSGFQTFDDRTIVKNTADEIGILVTPILGLHMIFAAFPGDV